MGLRVRPMTILAWLLAPAAAHAQLAPVGVPKGELRVDLDGAIGTWDHRWRDGTREPLGADLSSSALGSDLFPALATADTTIARIIGIAGYRLNLGALTTDARAEDSRGYLGLALGLTRAVTVFGRMPLVRVRVQDHFALDPTTADAGSNPGIAEQGTFFQQFDGSLAALGARITAGDFDGDPALKARAQSAFDGGTALRTDLYGLLADPTTASPYVPLATSAAGTSITTRVSDLQTSLATDFGVSGFTAVPALPTTAPTTDELTGAVSDAFGATAIRTGDAKVTYRGDAELGAALTLADRWDRGRHRGGFRAAVEGLVRLPTGQVAQPDRLYALGTGDGQTDLELRVTADLGSENIGLRAEGLYNRQLAADYLLRVAPPTEPLAGIDRLATVRRDPGDIVSVALRPFVRLAPTFALQGTVMFWKQGADAVSYLSATDAIPGVDAAVLAEDSKVSATTLGLGVTYSNQGRQRGGDGLPLDASWSYERIVRSSGGIVPDVHRMRAKIRFYFELF